MKKSEADRFLNDAKELKEDVNDLERDVKAMDLSSLEQQVATHGQCAPSIFYAVKRCYRSRR